MFYPTEPWSSSFKQVFVEKGERVIVVTTPKICDEDSIKKTLSFFWNPKTDRLFCRTNVETPAIRTRSKNTRIALTKQTKTYRLDQDLILEGDFEFNHLQQALFGNLRPAEVRAHAVCFESSEGILRLEDVKRQITKLPENKQARALEVFENYKANVQKATGDTAKDLWNLQRIHNLCETSLRAGFGPGFS